MTSHDHRWVYLCDAVLTYTSRDLQAVDPEISRLEYCIGCGTVRTHLSDNRWAVVESEITKDFLRGFEKTTSRVLKDPPEEFTFRPAKVIPINKRRLGRGLSDLLSSSPPNGIKGLLPKKGD